MICAVLCILSAMIGASLGVAVIAIVRMGAEPQS